jgi:uncharacterized membrane protein (DUF2068 family)
VAAGVGPILAWGLWRRRQWSWYASVVCAIGAASWIVWPAHELVGAPFRFLATPPGVNLALLVLLLGVLLFSNARRLCSRS